MSKMDSRAQRYLSLMADRVRLDALMVERGLFPTRSRAAAAVMAGEVAVGAQRTRVSKPGTQVSPDVDIAVAEAPRYVSRGGLKLAHALLELGLPVRERLCLDVGASSGGFTDCLLQHGAAADRQPELEQRVGELQ